jgi:hypothetical protein
MLACRLCVSACDMHAREHTACDFPASSPPDLRRNTDKVKDQSIKLILHFISIPLTDQGSMKLILHFIRIPLTALCISPYRVL